ncbi:MAG: DUF4105 domain-containing protein, partial [Bdellovibrionales bacterium]|nr:DUF4105 domain-containing protein [Bdellovibrionales bacterium]
MLWTLLFLWSFAHAEEALNSTVCFEQNSVKASEQKLWENPEWLGMVHYREGWFHPVSEADGDFFFLSPNGASSPKEELFATIKSLCDNLRRKTPAEKIPFIQARCQFPAREGFLEGKGLGGWTKPECPDLEDWKRRVGSERVHMVFSSYYANNPSSVFGHTLLRFDRTDQVSGMPINPLLNYGVNFAGETNTSNGVLFAILGMTGGFKGKFASLPYYYKVREYSDFDARDLWEYELNLTPDQIQRLLNNIWEQGFSFYNYYYFTENCSYHLLTALDVAVPEYHLDRKIPYWVIPIDSVKAVSQRSPGLVKSVHFRPSLYRQFHVRSDKLREQKLASSFYGYIDNDK